MVTVPECLFHGLNSMRKPASSRSSECGDGAKICEQEKQQGGGVGGILSDFALHSTIWTPEQAIRDQWILLSS